jgi:hypothetical protein
VISGCDGDIGTRYSSSFRPRNVEGGMLCAIVDTRGADGNIAWNMLDWIEQFLAGNEEFA